MLDDYVIGKYLLMIAAMIFSASSVTKLTRLCRWGSLVKALGHNLKRDGSLVTEPPLHAAKYGVEPAKFCSLSLS